MSEAIPKLDLRQPHILTGDGEIDYYIQNGYRFDIHGKFIDKVQEESNPEPVKEFTCEICNKKFQNEKRYLNHINWHKQTAK